MQILRDVAGIPPSTQADLVQVLKPSSSDRPSGSSQKEAVLLVLLGLILTLKGSLDEEVIRHTTDSELRSMLHPVMTATQTGTFSWLLNLSQVRSALLAEFKKQKKAEEEKKKQELARNKLRTGKTFSLQELSRLTAEAGLFLKFMTNNTVASFVLDGHFWTFQKQGDQFVKQTKETSEEKKNLSNYREKNMGKRTSITSRYRGDVTGITEEPIKTAYDEFKSSFGKAPDSGFNQVTVAATKGTVKNSKEINMRKTTIKSSEGTDGKAFTEDEWVSYVKANEDRFKTSDIGAGWEHDSQAYLTTKERFIQATSERWDEMTPEELYENYDELPMKEFICYDNGGADEWVTGYDSLDEAARALYHNAYETLVTDPDLLESLGEFLGRNLFVDDEEIDSNKSSKEKNMKKPIVKSSYFYSPEGVKTPEEAITKMIEMQLRDYYPNSEINVKQVLDIGNEWDATDEEIIEDPELNVQPTVLLEVDGKSKSITFVNDGGSWGETELSLAEDFPGIQLVESSKEKGMRKPTIKSARGEVSDSTRQLVRDILDQVPSLVKVPAKQQGIKKEPYSSDHVCYFYTEEGPRKGSFVTVEFHVDPNDLYSEVYVTTRASFAAAADGDEARQDEREVTLDQITIEDLEDYSLADIDRIDRAVSKGFEGAQKFDNKVTSSRVTRCRLFSSRHRAFVASGKRRAIKSSSEDTDKYYFRDNFDGTEETGLSYDELKELVLDQLNPNTQFYKDVESGEVDIFDIEWDMIGGDFEGVDYGSMEDYKSEE